jgi:hypothetical protein
MMFSAVQYRNFAAGPRQNNYFWFRVPLELITKFLSFRRYLCNLKWDLLFDERKYQTVTGPVSTSTSERVALR